MLASEISKRKFLANKRRKQIEAFNKIRKVNDFIINREVINKKEEEFIKERSNKEILKDPVELDKLTREISNLSISVNTTRNLVSEDIDYPFVFDRSLKPPSGNQWIQERNEHYKKLGENLDISLINDAKEKSTGKLKEKSKLSLLNLDFENRLDDSVNANYFFSQNHTPHHGPNEMNSNRLRLIDDKINTQQELESKTYTGSKIINRWHFWWEKPESLIKVPSYSQQYRQIASKIGSLEKINHIAGGGTVQVFNEKPNWNRRSRIDNKAKGYSPRGGNVEILNQKLEWIKRSKIGSLANKSYSPGGGNIEIFDEPLKKLQSKPKIDTGLIFEQVLVPIDSVRSQAIMNISHSFMVNKSSKLKPIAENSKNKIKDHQT